MKFLLAPAGDYTRYNTPNPKGNFFVNTLPPTPAPITVQPITYHGWHDALKLSNGVVEAVVVPQLGRVLRFQFSGRPETDPLYEDPAWAGKTGADAGLNTWANFGGDKAWPAPQSGWPALLGHAWPPDKALDGSPYYAEILPDGVRLTSPVSVPFAARIVRAITLRRGEARVYFAQSLIKDPQAPAAVPLGFWQITQVRADAEVQISAAIAPGQIAPFQSLSEPGITEAAPFYAVTGGVLHITHDPGKEHKISAAPPPGVLALHYGPGLVFSEHFTPPPAGAPFAPFEQPAEVYSAPGKPGYFELEILTPLAPLKAGERVSLPAYWEIRREKT